MTRVPALVVILLIVGLTAPRVYAADADQSFLNKAAEGGLAEVDAGKLAQSKGASKEVRDFGAMMVADHSKANEKLKGVAARKNVKLPTELNEKHKVMKRELEAASSASRVRRIATPLNGTLGASARCSPRLGMFPTPGPV